MRNIFKGKIVLVTGGSGSIGSEIVRHVLKYNPRIIRIFSNDEDGQFNLQQELSPHKNLRFLLGDVRDRLRLKKAIEDVDIVFHAAALKHVPACETNPFEAVMTNVIGTQNLIDVALEEEVEKMVMISTDKSTNPINVLGATKLLAERLAISAQNYKGTRKTVFCCVRFGNVLASRGSVIPIFKRQIAQGGAVTVTDPNMTRFVMSISDSVELVLRAAAVAVGGETFILKMPALKIGDLAQTMIEIIAPRCGCRPSDISIKQIGLRRGEKFHEELLNESEASSSYETEQMFVLVSQGTNGWHQKNGQIKSRNEKFRATTVKSYSSDSARLLSRKEIINILTPDILTV